MNYYSSWICLLFACTSAVACTSRDAQYYSVHPKALQEAIAECPDKAPKLVQCDALHTIALKVNEYVYELRMSPQGYGQTILALQETIAKQEATHQANEDPLLQTNKTELRERLAIVNWLESPAS